MAIEEQPAAPTAAPQGSRVDRAFTGSRTPADAQAAGKTTIADSVVAKVAGIAAREVAGVHALGGGGARARARRHPRSGPPLSPFHDAR